MPVLAKAVRAVEQSVVKGTPERTRFQVVALLVREERARLADDETIGERDRETQLKRLDGVATILAQSAARQPSLLGLLAEGSELTDAGHHLKRQMQIEGGLEPDAPRKPAPTAMRSEKQVIPQSVLSAQLANPFQAPDFSAVTPMRPSGGRLTGWPLIEPLLDSFEYAPTGVASCMELPPATTTTTLLPPGLSLMPHQSRVLAAAERGHRTFLLADEPGLGKTAQALLAAHAADAYPLLCVVPSVVKTNWAREVALWTPQHTATVIHGDGDTVDGFADIVIVNYEVLDRHVGWIGAHGFRGMVVDEAHFIKNKKSQRSQHVIETAERIRQRIHRPLMMALTGTPLINDIDDFRAIWEFLGWIDRSGPTRALMASLEETGLTPVDNGWYAAARDAVVAQGIVRRRKIDVAKDIPARRVADLPVELDGAAGRSIRAAEAELVRRMVSRYDSAIAAREERTGEVVAGVDESLVHRVAGWELKDAEDSTSEDNVFTMVRKIGRAKAELAADYAAQVARSAGKVVFFAKHIDVMDAAGELFASRGIRYGQVRGDQTPTARQRDIDAFTSDPEVAVIICSLTAAGVGLNLQVASDVVLAELSWTNAEQTQAIDRVHRIGQEQPVTAWRVIAAQTIDTRIAELIDAKAGLASRALDGEDQEVASPGDVRLEALARMLSAALSHRVAQTV